MALDLADLAQAFDGGAFSVLGHSREELRLGEQVVAAAELEATLMSASAEVIDCVVVSLPDAEKVGAMLPVACLVLPEGVELTEEHAAELKKRVHEALGESCVPADFVRIGAIPRTHNAKCMRHVVQRLFVDEGAHLKDVSEIANPTCLIELKACIDDWRHLQSLPVLDERC